MPASTIDGHAACACGVSHGEEGGGRRAVGVDAGIKERNLKRLRRVRPG